MKLGENERKIGQDTINMQKYVKSSQKFLYQKPYKKRAVPKKSIKKLNVSY